jgi:co-chaperonin GroES (HSP10)
MSQIRPVGHKILIKPLEWDQETEWGFQITASDNSELAKIEKAGRMIGVLVSIGPQAWKAHSAAILPIIQGPQDPAYEAWAAVGDTVMYSRYSGRAIYDPLTGKEHYLINDEDVLAVFPPKEEWQYKPTEKGEKV